jgi:hypothetical protein
VRVVGVESSKFSDPYLHTMSSMLVIVTIVYWLIPIIFGILEEGGKGVGGEEPR